jgi:hypothetical protein
MSVVALILTLLAAGGVGLMFWARRGRLRLTGPVCGGCGYNVLGLGNMTCPECGGDLRHVGILTPDTPGRPRGALGGIITFTLIVLFIAIITGGPLASILPLRRSDTEQVRLTGPRSGAYREAVVHADGATFLPRPSGLPVVIDLSTHPSGGSAPSSSWMLVRPDGSYEYVASGSPRVVRPDGFGWAAIMTWMKASGINISPPVVVQEAARIAGETHMVNRNTRRAFAVATETSSGFIRSGGDRGPFASYAVSQHAESHRPAWASAALIVVWGAIWICGLRYLLPGRREVRGRR